MVSIYLNDNNYYYNSHYCNINHLVRVKEEREEKKGENLANIYLTIKTFC